MKRARVVLVVVSVLLPVAGAAQLVPAEGQRVRVSRTDGKVVSGTVSFASSEEVRLIAGRAGEELLIPQAEIRLMEESLGRQRNFAKNFGITLISASFGLAAVSAIAYEPCTETGFLACFLEPTSRGEAALFGLIAGGALGLSAGLIVGFAAKSEKWTLLSVSGPGESALRITPVVGRRLGVSGSLSLGGW